VILKKDKHERVSIVDGQLVKVACVGGGAGKMEVERLTPGGLPLLLSGFKGVAWAAGAGSGVIKAWLMLLISLTLGISSPVSAYRFMGYKWPRAEATFYYDIVDTKGNARSLSGTSWNEAFREAMDRWTNRTGFVFDAIDGISLDPCQEDQRNTVAFRRTDCGFEFGSTTLAVTYGFSSRGTLSETDIVFNGNELWDVYDGPLGLFFNDFTRVAVHELGHAIGLDHEDDVTSIMSSFAGDLSFPQHDDIEGVLTLYEGEIDAPNPCDSASAPLPLNIRLENRLTASDCRRAEIIATTPGRNDASLVDLYELNMPVSGLLVIRMQSEVLDSYLEVRDESGETIIAYDDDSGAGVNAFLTVRLEKGRYRVVANTAFSWAEEGGYTLEALLRFEGEAPVKLNDDKSVTIEMVEYGGRYYRATLIPFAPSTGPKGMYWRLGSATLRSPQPAIPIPGALVAPDSLDLIFNPIPALGRRYDVILQRYYDPDFPQAWIWRLKSAIPRS